MSSPAFQSLSPNRLEKIELYLSILAEEILRMLKILNASYHPSTRVQIQWEENGAHH